MQRVCWAGERVLVAGIIVALSVTLCGSVLAGAKGEWSQALREARKRYDQFYAQAKDVTVVRRTETRTQAGAMKAVTTIWRKGDKTRIETEMKLPEAGGAHAGLGSMKAIVIYDGRDTWMITSVSAKRKLSQEEALSYQRERAWWDLVPDHAVVAGVEEFGGRECYAVELVQEEKAENDRIWLDKESLVLVGGEARTSEGQTVRWVCSDFKPVGDGWQFPHKTEFFVGDDLISTTVVESVKLNQGVSDDLFDPDKAGAGPSPGSVCPRGTMEETNKGD